MGRPMGKIPSRVRNTSLAARQRRTGIRKKAKTSDYLKGKEVGGGEKGLI